MISNIARRFHIIPHIYIYNDTWNLGNPLWFGHGRRHNGLHCEPLSTESRLHEKHCHWTLTATLFSKKHYHTKKTGFPSFLIHATTQHLASRISGSLMNTPVLRNLSRWLAYFRIFSPAMDGTWLCKICDHGMFLKFGIIKQNCSISQGSLLLKGFCGSWVISPCTCRVDGEAPYGELALDWESCASIRSRFRRDISWIQWPITAEETTGGNDAVGDGDDDDDDAIPKRPICTKSLELNAPALLCMLDFFEGNFIDIGKLQSQALWVSCHIVSGEESTWSSLIHYICMCMRIMWVPPFAVSVVGLKVVPCIFWVCLLFRSDPCTPWWSTTFRTLRGRPTWMLGTWGGSTPSVSDGSWIPTSVARNPGTGVWKLMEWIYNHAKT